MRSDKLAGKQMALWTAAAMSAPLAIYAGKTSWENTLLTGTVCVGGVLLVLRYGNSEYGRLLRLGQLVVLSLVAGVFSREVPGCWGEDSGSMPLVMIALAALSAGNRAGAAGKVCCCIAWIITILYTIVLAAGVKNVEWSRLLEVGYYHEMVIVAFLLPAVWLLIPAKRSGGAILLSMLLFGVMISMLCFGTLSANGMADTKLPIYQYSKSLTLLGIAERFEALASVSLTLGLFCTLSLLLSGAEEMIKHGAVIAALIASINVPISPLYVVVLTLFAWIILPLVMRIKKVKKR